MRKIEKVAWSWLLLLMCVGGVVACESKSNEENESAEVADAVTAIDVDALLASPDSLVSQPVVLQGVCTHICKHGGCKIFLMGSDDTKTIRVEAGEAIGSFPAEVVNNLVEVEGVLVEDRIDEAYLTQWEAQVQEQLSKAHEGEGGSGGCAADMKANAEAQAKNVAERIANFRKRIKERNELEGKPYVSLYHVEAEKYKIL